VKRPAEGKFLGGRTEKRTRVFVRKEGERVSKKKVIRRGRMRGGKEGHRVVTGRKKRTRFRVQAAEYLTIWGCKKKKKSKKPTLRKKTKKKRKCPTSRPNEKADSKKGESRRIPRRQQEGMSNLIAEES